MDIDTMTIGEFKELSKLFSAGKTEEEKHPLLGEKVIIRTYSAGAHYGTLVHKSGKECRLKDARRIWYWKGAASLSQLAMEGTKEPSECKFPCAVDSIDLEWIEILSCTPTAQQSIEGVPVWER